jgi:hypothetical protein
MARKEYTNITGATITSNALMKSIRSILAVYRVAVKDKGSNEVFYIE